MTESSPLIVWSYGDRYPFMPLPSFDPMTLTILAYLKFNNINYLQNDTGTPLHSTPTHRLPYISIANRVVSGPEFLPALLQMGIGTDGDEEEGRMVYNYLVGHVLDKVVRYHWWYKECNYNYIKYAYGQMHVYPKSLFHTGKMRKSIKMGLDFEGLNDEGRVNRLARNVFSTLETLIGDKKYFSGTDRPCSLDAYAFGYLAPILCGFFADRTLHHIILNDHPKLYNFVLYICEKHFGISSLPTDAQQAHEYAKQKLGTVEQQQLVIPPSNDTYYYYFFILLATTSIAFSIWKRDNH